MLGLSLALAEAASLGSHVDKDEPDYEQKLIDDFKAQFESYSRGQIARPLFFSYAHAMVGEHSLQTVLDVIRKIRLGLSHEEETVGWAGHQAVHG